MALFGSQKDASFLRNIAREVMQRVISVDVELYKLSLDNTDINIYNESSKKTYFSPVRFACLVKKDDTVANDSDTGLDFSKNISFAFLRDDLVELDYVCQVGDLIKFDNRFFEIDNVRSTTYWFGRNPENLSGIVDNIIPDYGYSISVIAETHVTRLNAVNIVETRSGISSIKNIPKVPKNL
jgi:hypothetical protein